MPQLTPEQKETIYLASGTVHEALAQQTADALGIELGPMSHKQFPDTEIWTRYDESVRGKQVFIMQSMARSALGSVNDALMQTIVMTDAAKRSAAQKITVVAPYLAYARQDRKNKGRDPITGAATINILANAGASGFVAVDMHSPQAQGVFLGPFDHLTAMNTMQDVLQAEMALHPQDDYIVIAPDAGRVKVSEQYAQALDTDMKFIPKSRDQNDPSTITRQKKVKGVRGKTAIVIDDMIDTAGTLSGLVTLLHDSGASRLIVGATHGVFSGPALERLQAAPIDKLFVTDTIPQHTAKEVLGERLEVVPMAPILAEAIGAIATNGSVSAIFKGKNYS